MNHLEHVDELLYLYCWCGHRVRAQLLYSDADQRQEEWRTQTGMGLHSQHSFVFGIYFIQNKGENGTVPADVFIIISLQHTAHCRMRPHGEAKGGEWRLLQPTVLSLFSPPPAPPNVPRPACSHPRHGWTFSNSPAEFASRSEKILRKDFWSVWSTLCFLELSHR